MVVKSVEIALSSVIPNIYFESDRSLLENAVTTSMKKINKSKQRTRSQKKNFTCDYFFNGPLCVV
jgi:hypothetical protein